MGSLLEILDKISDQQIVLGERTAREFKPRIPIDINTDIMEIIIALIKTDSVFIESSLPYLFFLVNRILNAIAWAWHASVSCD